MKEYSLRPKNEKYSNQELDQLMRDLYEDGVRIKLVTEEYVDGMNYLCQVNSKIEYLNSGLYGDNGTFLSREDALSFAIDWSILNISMMNIRDMLINSPDLYKFELTKELVSLLNNKLNYLEMDMDNKSGLVNIYHYRGGLGPIKVVIDLSNKSNSAYLYDRECYTEKSLEDVNMYCAVLEVINLIKYKNGL